MLQGRAVGTYSFGNTIIWLTMAFQAGAINVGAFMACGQFVSHVTGFAGNFGFHVSQDNVYRALGIIVVPFMFMIGAMFSGYLVEVRDQMGLKPKYYISFGIITLLIGIVYFMGVTGFFGEFGNDMPLMKSYIMVGLLSLACGIQNGTGTTVTNSVIRTTHLSGTTTDLGLGITRILHPHLFPERHEAEKQAVRMRLALVVFFLFGSTFGAMAFMYLEYNGFLVPFLTSLGLFITLMLAPRFHKTEVTTLTAEH